MLSWLFNYWTVDQIIILIEEVDKKRKLRRLQGKTMNSTFADDLKDSLNGVIIQEPEYVEQAEQTENVKMSISTKPFF